MSQAENKSVVLHRRGELARMVIANPPVNALSKHVRLGLIDCIQQALDDSSIRTLMITSEASLFSAGADISEFASGEVNPPLPGVLAMIENSDKPVIAVLNGPAFGGGLELALACHYRVSFKGNKVGLPEVNLGILPGAGGTQRLPRLVGVAPALDMIVSGKPVKAENLPGLFDFLADSAESLEEAASSFADEIISQKAKVRRTSEITLDTSSVPPDLFSLYRSGIARQARGYFAPERCIQAIESAVGLPFEEGLKKEADLFRECFKSPQARGQQHIFFAERAASHVADYGRDTPVRNIEKVGVVGAGTMGGGIAMNFVNAGIPVMLLEVKQEALDKGLGIIRKNYEASASKGKLSLEEVEKRMSLLTGTTNYEDLSDVDLVIEAVFEKMDIKKEVFSRLDSVCKSGAILATNTSTLDINEIATVVSRPQDVIGLHFFSPANVMKLLEVVKTESTSAEVIKTSMQLARQINKVAVLVGVCFGFVGNRMIETYSREANRLLLEGASPEQIDRVIFEFGLPMGPFTMGDMAGLDIGYFVRQSRKPFTEHDPSYCVVADRLVEQGRVGLKVGRGAYLYEPGQRKPIPDPEVMEIARSEASRLGIPQREISDQEILERCIYPLINEGALILQEGIAAKASDIDVIYVFGYGFPSYRGGPMKYADEIGLKTVYDTICKYRDQLGSYGELWFQPAPLLKQLVEQDKTFNS